MSIVSNIIYAITGIHCCFSSNIFTCCATCFAQIEMQIVLRLSINAHRKQSFFLLQGLHCLSANLLNCWGYFLHQNISSC